MVEVQPIVARLPDGSRITLRPVMRDDVEPVYRAVRESIAEISHWMHWCDESYSLDHCRQWVESRASMITSGQEYDFAIVSATGEILGACGLNNLHPQYRMANLGYWISTPVTRRGIASVAARAVARFAFDALELVRVEIVVATGNIASQRVAEKSGATREGVLRSRLPVRERVYDAVMYSLIPSDFS